MFILGGVPTIMKAIIDSHSMTLMLANVEIVKKGWHAPPPHCRGWPQASCGADCPDFPKSSSDPHCGLRILIGQIFLCHPSSLNTFCNHLCRKLTVTMIITFAERRLKKAHWKPVRRERGLLDFYTSNFGPPISGSYNSTFWSLA